MQPGSVTDAFAWAFQNIGEILFNWVPATVITAAGHGTPPPPGLPAPVVEQIPNAVTVPEAIQFLQTASAPGVFDTLYYRWSVFVALSMFVSLLLATLIIYCIVRLQQIRYVERQRFAAAQRTVSSRDIPRTQLRWSRVIEQGRGDDEHKWRLAILEADIMLNELLDTLGYKGETMADKMKQVDRSKFNTIDLAWEAHAFRNRIAHQSQTVGLDRQEVRRVLSMYERVFREFSFVE